jgi:hypothetical protein
MPVLSVMSVMMARRKEKTIRRRDERKQEKEMNRARERKRRKEETSSAMMRPVASIYFFKITMWPNVFTSPTTIIDTSPKRQSF